MAVWVSTPQHSISWHYNTDCEISRHIQQLYVIQVLFFTSLRFVCAYSHEHIDRKNFTNTNERLITLESPWGVYATCWTEMNIYISPVFSRHPQMDPTVLQSSIGWHYNTDCEISRHIQQQYVVYVLLVTSLRFVCAYFQVYIDTND